MADYPSNEIVDMIKILGEARNNYSEAERLYAEKFPNRCHPCRKTIKRLFERAEQGTLKRIRRKSGANKLTLLAVLGSIALNPQTSTRKIEKEHGIPKSTVNYVLKTNRFHPYHIHLTHAIEEDDFNRRLRFCYWVQNQI